MTDPFSISIIIPVYNEEDSIAQSVLRNVIVLRDSKCDYEIILVNDGSKDASLSIIRQFFANETYLKIISYPDNGGFGKAVREGIKAATKDYILCVPADSPLNQTIFDKFRLAADRYDMIASYRRERIGYSWRMKLNSSAYHWLLCRLFGTRVRDFNWMHLYSKRIFEEAKFNLYANGIFFLAEIIIQCDRNGYHIGEIEVDQEMRLTGIATASRLSSIIKTLREMFRFRRLLR
jgi:dolichol-phosphate mannosyltransferase